MGKTTFFETTGIISHAYLSFETILGEKEEIFCEPGRNTTISRGIVPYDETSFVYFNIDICYTDMDGLSSKDRLVFRASTFDNSSEDYMDSKELRNFAGLLNTNIVQELSGKRLKLIFASEVAGKKNNTLVAYTALEDNSYLIPSYLLEEDFKDKSNFECVYSKKEVMEIFS